MGFFSSDRNSSSLLSKFHLTVLEMGTPKATLHAAHDTWDSICALRS